MSEITYLIGDVTQPVGSGPRIIAHVCNDVGAYDAGVAAAIRDRWPIAKGRYRAWYEGRLGSAARMARGMIQIVPVEEELWVANMVAQRGLPSSANRQPIDYPALRQCLGKLCDGASRWGASVHMPRIGTGYARGDWAIIGPMISVHLAQKGVSVLVYDYAS